MMAENENETNPGSHQGSWAKRFKRKTRDVDFVTVGGLLLLVAVIISGILGFMYISRPSSPPARAYRVSITLVDGSTNATVSPDVFYMKFIAYKPGGFAANSMYNKGEGWGKFWSNHTFTWQSYLENRTLCVLLNDTAGRYLPAFHDLVEGENVLTIYPVGWTP